MITAAYILAAVAGLCAVICAGYGLALLLNHLGLPLPTGLRLRIRQQPRARLTLTSYEPDYRPARLVSFTQPAAKKGEWANQRRGDGGFAA